MHAERRMQTYTAVMSSCIILINSESPGLVDSIASDVVPVGCERASLLLVVSVVLVELFSRGSACGFLQGCSVPCT